VVVIIKHSVVLRLREDLSVKFSTDRKTGADVDTRLIYTIGPQYLVCRHSYRVESKERVEPSHYTDSWLGEFLIAVKEAPPVT
jgi:hypothetical protein